MSRITVRLSLAVPPPCRLAAELHSSGVPRAFSSHVGCLFSSFWSIILKLVLFNSTRIRDEMPGLEIVGVIANIIALVDFGTKILARLDEYSSKDLPEVFRHIRAELPVMLNALRQTKKAIDDGYVTDEARAALLPVVGECMEQIKALDEVIEKALSAPGDSGFRRGFKAVGSFRYDSKVEKRMEIVRKYIATLTYHEVVTASSKSTTVPRPPPLPTFVGPFPRDQDFVEREVLGEVRLRSQYPASRLALVGLGGIGKSQIAIEYAYRTRDETPEKWVFWVYCGSVAKVEESYKKIAEAVRIQGHDEKGADILRLVSNWLQNEANGRWVMIIDNADDLDVFTAPLPRYHRSSSASDPAAPQVLDFIPQSPNGSILITSRNREVAFRLTGNYKDILDIEPMDETEAVTLLRKKLASQAKDDEMVRLVKALDYMPLAISQAAAYISKLTPRVTVSTYLQQLQEGDEEQAKLLEEDLHEPRRDKERANSIAATWWISFQYVRRTKPSASRLLSLMSLFNRQGIPESLLAGQYGEEVLVAPPPPSPSPSCISFRRLRRRSRKGKSKRQDNEKPKNTKDFNDDWATLTDFAFIKTNVDGHHFEMHRLVQFTMKKWLAQRGEMQLWANKYILLINTNMPVPRSGDTRECEAIFTHALSAIPYGPTSDDHHIQVWGAIMEKLASFTYQKGVYDSSENFYTLAFHAYKQSLGPNNPRTLRTMVDHGKLLSRMHRHIEAEKVQRQALEAREKTLGPEHPDTLASMDALADALGDQKRYEESIALLQRALSIRERLFGTENRETLMALNDLGQMYRRSGQFEEAEAMFRREHEASRATGGKENDSEWHNNLEMRALACHLLSGKLAEAEYWYRKAVETAQRTFGSDDIRTLTSIHRLAVVLYERGKFDEAETFYRPAYESFQRNFDEDKHGALSVMTELAYLSLKTGKLEEAETLCRRAIEGGEKLLGSELSGSTECHRGIFERFYLLADVLYKQGRREEALELYQRAYTGMRELLGENHDDTKLMLADLKKLETEMSEKGQDSAPQPTSSVGVSSAESFLKRKDLESNLGVEEKTNVGVYQREEKMTPESAMTTAVPV